MSKGNLMYTLDFLKYSNNKPKQNFQTTIHILCVHTVYMCDTYIYSIAIMQHK